MEKVAGGEGDHRQYAKDSFVDCEDHIIYTVAYGDAFRHRDPLRCHCAADLPVEQHQEPRPHLHQPEADHLSHHPALTDNSIIGL